jgi:TPP-dependent indolepyruvate ferredoxin oxidoreductase alpha subunit
MEQSVKQEDELSAAEETASFIKAEVKEIIQQSETPVVSQTKLYLLKSGNMSMKRKFD